MRITGHPPVQVAATTSGAQTPTLTPHLHAKLWLSVELGDWAVSRSGHLHLVRTGDDIQWRSVALARHPLQPRPDVASPSLDEITPLLLEGLELLDLRFHRIAGLGLVSELGEGREDFRRRALGLIRSHVQDRIDSFSGRSTSRLPWRRRSEHRRREAARAQIAAGLSTLADSIEERRIADVAAAVSRAELGTLLVPEGVTLSPARHRDLML